MARKEAKRSQARRRARRAATSVKKIFSKRRKEPSMRSASVARTDVELPIPFEPERKRPAVQRARPARVESDIPIERFDREYLPAQTGLKSGFRSDGADMHRDQEFASRSLDERWNEEDRFTNRTGDPRIGTHRRSYEPAKKRSGRDDE